MHYAIDFGTTNTVVAHWEHNTQQVRTLSLPGLSTNTNQSPPLIPSIVYVENAWTEYVRIGQDVRNRGLDNRCDRRFFRDFKRGIGCQLPFPHLDGKPITAEQLGQWFLSHIIQSIPSPIQSLVLTVPVDSFETYRQWLGHVCQRLEVEQVQMVDEPTAAALSYGLRDGERLLVIDFGGGTLDLSLVQLQTKAFQKTESLGFMIKLGKKVMAHAMDSPSQTAGVIAKAGRTLGGADIDYWLVDHFSQTQGIKINPLTTRLAEKIKIQLSVKPHAKEVYFDDIHLDSYELTLERTQLEAILTKHQLFTQLDETLFQVLHQAQQHGVETDDVDGVLLVGGTAQIPMVRTWVQKYFHPAKVHFQKPFEAIAHGALQLNSGIQVKDYLYHSYGVRYWNHRHQCHSWHPIIKAGQPYPMDHPVELVLGASVPLQPNIELIIGELATQSGGLEVFFDGDRLTTRMIAADQLTAQPLNDRDGCRDIAILNPTGHPGQDRIKVYFWVDGDRFLRIKVTDLLTKQTLLENSPVGQLK